MRKKKKTFIAIIIDKEDETCSMIKISCSTSFLKLVKL
jgi:hypothetical protein